MGLKDIIEGTGRGFWFGYGRFLGVHWGLASSQDVIKVTEDPFYNEKEFEQLVREPSHRYRSRWQGFLSEGRVLTEDEKEGIVRTLFEKAREYEGVARKRILQRLADTRDFCGTSRVEDLCVEYVNRGEVQPDLLRWMGSQALARVNPAISERYLSEKVHDEKISENEKKYFMKNVLFGLRVHCYIDEQRKEPVYTSENIVSWIPLVQFALESGALDEYDLDKDANKVEEFFAGFPYESALPYLYRALNCEVKAKGELLSSSVIGANSEMVSMSDDEGLGWEVHDWDEEHTWDVVEYLYQPKFPVADGAVKSLVRLKSIRPDLGQRIDEALKGYDNVNKTPLVKTRDENLRIGEPMNVRTYSTDPR